MRSVSLILITASGAHPGHGVYIDGGDTDTDSIWVVLKVVHPQHRIVRH
jgi:hypothetical protein